MLTGVLRWKGGGEKGSIWWLLYTQVSLLRPSAIAAATLMLQSNSRQLLGLGMGGYLYTC